jgi:hypothetical protein
MEYARALQWADGQYVRRRCGVPGAEQLPQWYPERNLVDIILHRYSRGDVTVAVGRGGLQLFERGLCDRRQQQCTGCECGGWFCRYEWFRSGRYARSQQVVCSFRRHGGRFDELYRLLEHWSRCCPDHCTNERVAK